MHPDKKETAMFLYCSVELVSPDLISMNRLLFHSDTFLLGRLAYVLVHIFIHF